MSEREITAPLDLEQLQAQRRELGGSERGVLRDFLLDAPHEPERGGVKDQPQLVGIGRAA